MRSIYRTLIKSSLLAAALFSAAGFARAADLDLAGFEYKNFAAKDGAPAHLYIVRLPQGYTFADTKRIVRGLIDDSRLRGIAGARQKIKFFVTGHGWKASAQDYLEYAAFLSRANGADIGIVCDFPEFRNQYPLNWHSLNVGTSRKTASIV